jgi:hypothetical protein
VSGNPLFYDIAVTTAVNAGAALLNSGYLNIYTGSQPVLDAALTGTLLASLRFGATAFGAAAALTGTVSAVANAITTAVAAASGTAGYFALLRSDGSTVFMTGTCGTSGSDLNMSSTQVLAGQVVAATTFSITQAQT